MSDLVTGPDNDLLNGLIHNPDDTGWYFGSGEPEFWSYADRLVVPNGRVLDLGMGLGRTALFFGLNGMEVVGYDMHQDTVERVNQMAEVLSKKIAFNVTARIGDVLAQPLGIDEFDLVISSHLNHLPSKKTAFDLFDRAFAALKPGGYMWVRGVGKESSGYYELLAQSRYDSSIRVLDDDVIEHGCECSGRYAVEPSLFFDQTDLIAYFAGKGANIVHSQTSPTEFSWNIMFGEDYNRDISIWRGGLVTVLAQKAT